MTMLATQDSAGRTSATLDRSCAQAPSPIDPRAQKDLVDHLRRSLHDSRPGRVLETHISYVLLAGDRAYKIKKAVNLGFLDFTALDARRRYCEAEVRLNRRSAKGLYLGVVPITANPGGPVLDGSGPVVEYAVEMLQFPQEALMSAVLERGELAPATIDRLARVVADFHHGVPRASPSSLHGRPEQILERAMENVSSLRAQLLDTRDRDRLSAIDRWTRREHTARKAAFEARRHAGRVRECHGDLHLGNIVLLDGEVVPFDCIEFSEDLRWIDVVSEIAFTVMDLQARGHPTFAHRLLNAYLEITGDYEGLAVLRFYLVYRAMVRAKIAAIRASQGAMPHERSAAQGECSHYLRLALHYTHSGHGALVITHGFSGSGKTTLTQPLLEHVGAIRIRSDVERKRMHGMTAQARSASAVAGGIYGGRSTAATYEALLAVSRLAVDNGYPAIVDATFLKRWQRVPFADLARAREIPFVVLTFEAPLEVLRQRVIRRAEEGRDASEATTVVLEHQIRTAEPLDAHERQSEVCVDATSSLDAASDRLLWHDLIRALHEHRGHLDSVASPFTRRALEAKVACLRETQTYGEDVRHVETIETHLSWVFLNEREAFKLKKPVSSDYVDLRSVFGRGQNCADEVTLNRRLTTDVYLGVVALTDEGERGFALEGAGPVIDWLVHMRRLPSHRMLDALIRTRDLDPADLVPAIARLAELYQSAPRAEWSGEQYCVRLRASVEQTGHALERYSNDLPEATHLATRQLALISQRSALLRTRADAGRVVEAHGDLRPEHICLEAIPQIIDALEFSRDLRMLDPIDDLGFLALECARLGATGLQDVIFATYARCSRDEVDPGLLALYQSHRAAIRARLAIAHVEDGARDDRAQWVTRARAYLELALAYARMAS